MEKQSLKRFFTVIIVIIVLIASGIIISDEVDYQSDFYDEYTDDYQEQEYCSIMGIPLYGEVTTYSVSSEDENGLTLDSTSADDVIWAIRDAELNDNVSAILLEIDSYGGSGVAGDEIAIALKEATKPTVVIVRNGATSAAYWAATGADYIVASPISDIGGIGVTAAYLDYTKQNLNEGIAYVDLSSAKFKNMGDPDKVITPEEKALWQRDLDIMHQYFVEQVAINRDIEVDKVASLSDGSTMMGQMALDNGLIDEVGGMKQVMQYFIDKGVIENEEDVCWY